MRRLARVEGLVRSESRPPVNSQQEEQEEANKEEWRQREGGARSEGPEGRGMRGQVGK